MIHFFRPSALILSVALVLSLACVAIGWSQETVDQTVDQAADQAGPTERPAADASQLWQTSLDGAISKAAESNKPIFVIVTAPWCVYCDKLEKELDGASSIQLAERWVLAKIDADERVSDAREMRANGLPSLRLLSKDGIIAAGHDGYMPLDELVGWLDKNHEAVTSNVPQMLDLDPSEFTDAQIAELIELISTRDVTVRRIVIERLAKIPNRCVAQAIDLLESNRLAKQLSAMELLRRWQAPIDGLDPWVPGAIDQDVISRLRHWSQETYPDAVIEA